MAGFVISIGSSPVAANDSWNRKGTKPAKVADGKLKWLPYRPTIPRPTSKVVATQHVVASTSTSISERRVARRNSSGPFNDPFGDRNGQGMAQRPTPAGSGMPNAFERPPAAAYESVPRPLPKKSLPPINDSPIVRPNAGITEDLDFPDGSGADFIEGGALEESFAQGNVDLRASCPSVDDLKKINELGVNIRAKDGDFPEECPLGNKQFVPRHWDPVTFTWKASGLCHNPLYFEDVHLERYGHSWGPYLQPIMSGGHFFLTVPILPYKMGLQMPSECMYTLGYYRPGNCAPYMLDPIPLSVRAALLEGGAWVAGVAIIP